MDSYQVFKQADNLVQQFGTRNAELIAREMGIWIYYEESFNDLLGMYAFLWKHRIIFLNPKIEGQLKEMVIAHEIGHDQRHRDIAKAGQPLKEFSLFSSKEITEYEANAFASHILLSNDDVLSLAKEGNDVFSISRQLGVDINLTLIKIHEMERMGYKNLRVDMDHDSRFFRKIKGSQL